MKRFVVISSLIGLSLVFCSIYAKTADQLHTYFMANYKHFDKQWDEALRLYKRTLSLESPVFAHKGLVHFLRDTNNDHLIIQLQPVIEKEFAQDNDIQFILAQAYANVGQEAQSDELLIKLNQKSKNNQEIAFQTAQTYIRRKEPENALQVIDSLLNNSVRKPTHFVFHFLKAQIYLQLEKKDEALISIKTCLDLHPRFEKGWFLRALLEEKAGRLEEAIKGYTNFLELAGPQREIEQHLVGLVFKQKIAGTSTNAIIASKNSLTNALDLFEQQKYTQALSAVQQCLDKEPNNNEAKILKIQILAALNELPQIFAHLKTWAIAEPDQPLWLNTLHLMYRNGIDPHMIIKTLHEIEKQAPSNGLINLYLADLYMRIQSVSAATNYLKRALQNTEPGDLQDSLLAHLATLYYENKQYKQLKDLHKKYEPTNSAAFYNVMAYFYATKEQNLALAQELVEKALTMAKNNPHILDTQATIYFAQKQYDKALAILQKIAVQEPNDYTIIKHLAQTYEKKGDKNNSKKYLERLITLTTDEKKQKKYQQMLVSWNKK